MTRAWILPTIALAALPLLAEEKAKPSSVAPAPSPANATAANAAEGGGATQAGATQDSPLVAAAKRMNRLGKKPTNVITNETLAKSGGNAHVTTSSTPLKPINLPPPAAEATPTPEMIAARKAADERKKAETAAAAQKKAEEERQNRVHLGARLAEESIEERYEADAESYKGDKPKDPPPPSPPPPQF